MSQLRVSIQPQDFDLSTEVAALRAGDARVGAVCAFVGTVRDRHPAELAATGEPEPMEEDMLDFAFDVRPNSRLSCQAIVNETPLVVEIPRYSINMAKEGKR